MSLPRYILLKGSTHGLANRLFVLSTAIRLCKITGAKLLIDWNDDTYGVPFWDAFALEGCGEIISPNQDPTELNGLRSAQSAWEGQYEATVKNVYEQVSGRGEYAGIDLQEIPQISGLKTFFEAQQQKDVLVLAGYQKRGQSPVELLRHFRLSTTWREKLLDDLHTQSETVRSGAYVGLHIRAAAGNLFPRFQSEQLVRYLKRHSSLGLFVATDLLIVEDELKLLFKERLLPVTRIYASSPNIENDYEPFALHRMRALENQPTGRILYEAVRDLLLLSKSHTIFAQPYSTFSEFACLFSSCPPWRLHLSGPATWKYHAGNWLRGVAKYRVNGRCLLGGVTR